MKISVYPGSFDPVTNGHIDIIERASKLFDEVLVTVIKNPGKTATFSVKERMDMLTSSIEYIKNAKVDSFEGLLVDYAQEKKANAIIRGLRAVSDFDYEFQMALMNRRMTPKIETVFMMTDYKYSYLSSSFVKQIVSLGGSVDGLVPEVVIELLKRGKA